MSEDCHGSDNINPLDDWNFHTFDEEQITFPCTECGEPITAQEAYPVEINHIDGTTEIALFHRDFQRLCPLKWAGKRLEKANENLLKTLDILNEAVKQLKKGADVL